MGRGKIIGFDISDTSCQISSFNEETQEPETHEASPESYQIPLVIGKRNDIWAIGVDAKRLAILHEGDLVNNLLTKSIKRKKVRIGNENYDAVWLLSKFVEMSLKKFEDIEAIVFTVPVLNEDISQILRAIANHIGIKKENVYVQDYRESFCNYMFYQPKELWQYEAAMFYCDKEEVRACMLKRIHTGIDNGDDIFVTVEDVASAKNEEMDTIYPLIHGEKAREADAQFSLFIESVFEQRVVSAVYLTGEGFENNWYPESLKILCNGRRAFMGNNLYSRGACYTAYRRMLKRNEGLIYIDENKLTERICMKIRLDGDDKWFPIVSWGSHWYENDSQWEVILEDTEEIELLVESLYKGTIGFVRVNIDELPERESYSLRLQIETIFTDDKTCKIIFKDIGFGDFFPSTGFETDVSIQLGGNNGQHYSLS